jgi:predicted nuclease of predicted toxin-antitoxin system
VRILINEWLPTRCRAWFPGHGVETVEFRGWKGVLNGALLARTVEAGFEVLLTADRMMVRQHDFSKLPLAVVVTFGNRLSTLNDLRDAIVAAVERTAPGDTVEVPGPTAAGETLDGSETAP